MQKKTLLLEIGTEELPPKALLSLSKAFVDGVCDGLRKAGLEFSVAMPYSTPRRLSVLINDLDVQQKDKDVIKRGPATHIAYDKTNQPTSAALGFARSCGVDISELQTIETDKGSWLAYPMQEKGQETVALLPAIAESALIKLPIPKRMRWGEKDIEFVRPVHWVVAMFDEDVIQCRILDVAANNETLGHRFHHPTSIQLRSATSYLQQLQETGKVMADFERRRAVIRDELHRLADEVGGQALIDEDLLNEVTSLVEWPVALPGKFNAQYLGLPAEVLIATMQGHQKYFPVVDKENILLPYFISIVNIESKTPEVIQKGNQRVITARLNDADFFWKQDIQNKLADLRHKLAGVIFQQQLGSMHDKSERIVALSVFMAEHIPEINKQLVQRAGELSKCDLLTNMVGEFPELQGSMGSYYAREDGEDLQLAAALAEQYKPRFAEDEIAGGKIGQLLAIADKLDTLIGIFSIGEAPTGDKDPFALRRAALGVLRTMIEGKLGLNLRLCLRHGIENYGEKITPCVTERGQLSEQIFDFMMERLRGYYMGQNIATDNFVAVLAQQPERPYDFHQRLHAVIRFRQLPQATALIAANKRIANILRLAKDSDSSVLNESLLKEDSEQKLARALTLKRGEIEPLLDKGEYADFLAKLAGLKADIDSFFDHVMVMSDDKSLQDNRLALLRQLSALFLQVADISKLQQPA